MTEDVGVRYRRYFRRDRGGDGTLAKAVDPTRDNAGTFVGLRVQPDSTRCVSVGTVMVRSGPTGTSPPSAIASPALSRSGPRGWNGARSATPTP